jgi:ubiquinone/menaquinone biosynthesis C-methylase UbiE
MTAAASVIDSINRDTMRASVEEYAHGDELTAAEKAALDSVLHLVRNRRILDLGVGGGRTVRGLRQLSRDYVGIDYVPEMVAQCRTRFPFVRFEHADARSMPQYADSSFDVVMFAMNGLCMVDHSDRLKILGEVRRVLSPDGVFIFSTYNQASAVHDKWFAAPDFSPTPDPVQFARRFARFSYYLGVRAVNRMRFVRHETRTSEYSIINDRCHHYRTMLYYITLENQCRQLQTAGFRSDPRVFDLTGREITTGTADDSMMFVARPRMDLAVVSA